MRFVEADTIHIPVGAGTYTVGEMHRIGDSLGVIQGETLVVPAGGSGVIVLGMKGAARYDDVRQEHRRCRVDAGREAVLGRHQQALHQNGRLARAGRNRSQGGGYRLRHRKLDHHRDRPDLIRRDG